MRSRQPTAGSAEIVGLLDIGSTKITCLIAALPVPGGQPAGAGAAVRVLGIGHQRSAGVKAGVITDLDAVEAAIRATVSQAERSAGVTVEAVVVSVSCGRLKSATFAAHAAIEGGVVRDGDIARALAGGRAYAEKDGRTLIHMTRVGYRLDGVAGVEEPRGMAADRLTADLHAVTADDAPVRNLLLAVERCNLTTAGLVAAPYAGAIAVTTPEERQLGVTAIDMGGGATTIAMFAEGHFLHTDAVAVGGHHLTIDIARALSAPLAECERIKALYGTLVAARSDESEPITYPRTGDDEEALYTTTKAHIRSIIVPRVDSLLRLLGERIAQAPAAALATRHVVLTGGAAQLVGLAEYAANVLGHPVRVARPLPVGGLPASVCSPAFSVVVGLLQAISSGDVAVTAYRERDTLGSGYLHRVGAWLREF